jgi:predicted ATP-grasp superfamily ATP-dependent carboligase
MRVFVYEHLCATGATDSTLRTEGRAMLAAVSQDFSQVPGVEVVTLFAGDHCPLAGPVSVRHIGPGEHESAFRELAAVADFSLVIAPEYDRALETRCRWVEEVGGRLLGPDPAAVVRTADKLDLAQWLRDAGVPTPPSRLLLLAGEAVVLSYEIGFPAVLKPRRGAGSQATFLVRCPEELAGCAARATAEGWSDELIVQPFVPGQPTSVAFLLGPRRQLALLPASQHLSADGRFRYCGGSLPLPADLAARAQRLGQRAVQAVPGLRGYVGVDLVLGETAAGSADQVIEINPRLTTSYVGLRALAATNLATALLGIVRGEATPDPAWRAGTVHFQADGTSQFLPPGYSG